MKRSNELDDLFNDFVNDLMLLVRESKAISASKNEDITKIQYEINKKLINQKKSFNDQFNGEEDYIEFIDNPFYLFKKRGDLNRIKKISHNGNFLYALALFENFASKVIKITFNDRSKSKSSPKERYIHKFQEFAINKSKENNESFLRMLRSPKEMINNYDELPDVLNIWLYVLNINKDGLFKKVKPKYIELRERRNLLVHRGTLMDERYKKSFTKANMASDNGQNAKKILDAIIENYSYESPKGIDLSASPEYLINAFDQLLIMSYLIYIHSFKLSKEDDSIFPRNLLHELMVFADEIDKPHIFFLLEALVLEHMKNFGDKKTINIPELDRLNLLISSAHLLEYYEKRKMYFSKKKNNQGVKIYKDRISREKEILESKRKAFGRSANPKFKKNLKLIDSHINGDFDKLMENIKKDKTIDYIALDTWFMFKKYSANKKFIEYKNNLKEANGGSNFKLGLNKKT